MCQYLPGFSQAPVDPPIPCPSPPGAYVRCGQPSPHWDLASVNAGGSFKWDEGNIPGSHFTNDVVLDYGQTYRLQGWTILPSEDGTRFTNDATGHGMFVSVDNVNPF